MQAVRVQQSPRWLEVLCYFVVSLMMVCLADVLMLFLAYNNISFYLFPAWGFVIAWEAFLSYRVARTKTFFSKEWCLTRSAEWVVLLATLKVFLETQHGIGSFFNHLVNWKQYFASGFFTPEYLVALLSLSIVWVLSTFYAYDLSELTGYDTLIQHRQKRASSTNSDDTTTFRHDGFSDEEILPSNRRVFHQHIVYRTLAVGIGVVILVSFPGMVRAFQQQDLSSGRMGSSDAILYFILSFWLFSQTNLFALQFAWNHERTSFHQKLSSHWVLFSIVFLCIIGALSVILPTGYSLGLLETMKYLGGIFTAAIEFLIGVLTLPILLLLRLFSFLSMGGGQKPQPAENPPMLPPSTATPAEPMIHPVIPWWNFLRSFAFWVIFLVILFFALYQYINQNKYILNALRALPLPRWFQESWRFLRKKFEEIRKGLQTNLQGRIYNLRKWRNSSPQNLKFPWKYVNPSRLPVRQQVIFYYLAMLRRGIDAGYPRQPSQTPSAYGHMLNQIFIEQRTAVEDITDAYIEARYSRHDLSSEQANRVKQAWERVRKALRSNRNRA